MELVRGEPIAAYCDERRLPIRDRLRLILRVCQAVRHAHQRAILHRDLSPANILVATNDDGDPDPKVIDFGLAKSTDEDAPGEAPTTQQQTIIGNPCYMSPEQADISCREYDVRTDVYSLGAVMYELLTGTPPLVPRTGETHWGFYGRVREEEPPRPSTRVRRRRAGEPDAAASPRGDPRQAARSLRGDLDWIVMRAIAKEPERRYQGVGELADDIERYLTDRPVRARPPAVSYRLRKFIRRHPTGTAVSAIAVLVAVAATARGLERWQESRRFREIYTKVDAALRRDDLTTAEARVVVLREDFPGRSGVRDLEEAVARARSRRDALDARREAREAWTALEEQLGEVEGLHATWLELSAKADEDASRPVWERDRELSAWRLLGDARARTRDAYREFLRSAERARELLAAVGEETRDVDGLIAAARRVRAGDLGKLGGLDRRSGVFVPTGEERADRSGELSVLRVTSSPPRARVHLFRYESLRERLVPLPMTPAGPVRTAGLPVEAVAEPWRGRFRVGDRLLSIGDQRISTAEDVAAALAPVESGASVAATVWREGASVSVEWTPFPEGRPERVEPFRGLGLTLPAYPLDVSDGFRAASFRGATPLELTLPPGSYLLVLAAPGRAETRYPWVARHDEETVRVDLAPAQDVPPGFVLVPGGPVALGGDTLAFQSEEWGEADVPAFLLARREVTFGEWKAFLEDLDRRGIGPDEDGEVDPRSADAIDLARRVGIDRVSVRPESQGVPLLRREADGGAWGFHARVREWTPVMGISHLAALEHAHWRCEQAGPDRRWDYRLPTDREWERAARGVDRRIYVWGNYPVWSFCASGPGLPPPRPGEPLPLRAGLVPTDESVFGVLDMGGSVTEHTVGAPAPDPTSRSYRGGNWYLSDDIYFRLASRNTFRPHLSRITSGLRLAASLRRATRTEERKDSPAGPPRDPPRTPRTEGEAERRRGTGS